MVVVVYVFVYLSLPEKCITLTFTMFTVHRHRAFLQTFILFNIQTIIFSNCRPFKLSSIQTIIHSNHHPSKPSYIQITNYSSCRSFKLSFIQAVIHSNYHPFKLSSILAVFLLDIYIQAVILSNYHLCKLSSIQLSSIQTVDHLNCYPFEFSSIFFCAFALSFIQNYFILLLIVYCEEKRLIFFTCIYTQ